MKPVNEKKVEKTEKKVSKSETRRSAVQKPKAEKKAKPVKKAEPKISEDEAAFNKFIEKYDATLTKRCGRAKLYGVYLAGIKRGKTSKK